MAMSGGRSSRCDEGFLENSPVLQHWVAVSKDQSPVGTEEIGLSSLPGLLSFFTHDDPSDESLGY
jgi:hypothetical protein